MFRSPQHQNLHRKGTNEASRVRNNDHNHDFKKLGLSRLSEPECVQNRGPRVTGGVTNNPNDIKMRTEPSNAAKRAAARRKMEREAGPLVLAPAAAPATTAATSPARRQAVTAPRTVTRAAPAASSRGNARRGPPARADNPTFLAVIHGRPVRGARRFRP
jgi:hypothetical protein